MDIKILQKEIISLKREKKIHEAQNKLFETFINMARDSKEKQALNITMQKALDIAAEFSGAEKANLFLMNKEGVVTDSIIIRDQIKGEERSSLIGKVVDKGLVGWVKKNLLVGLVKDTKTDPRWITLQNQPYIIGSALAVPVIRNDILFGIIILMHSLPGKFDQAAVSFIQQVANQMALVIENAKLYKKLEESNTYLEKARQSIEKYSKALDDELNWGKKIQKDFLPRQLPNVKNCEIAVFFHAALQLSGDFYDSFELPDEHLGFVMGDISGKGVGAALFMALARSFFRIFSGSFNTKEIKNTLIEFNEDFSPQNALGAVDLFNEYISKEHVESIMFVTLCFGIINQRSGELFLINCGHEPVLIIGKDGIKKSIYATGPIIGPIQGANYDIEKFQLQDGDMLFSYTDGVVDAQSEKQEFYSRERLEKEICNGFNVTPEKLLETIKSDLYSFIGDAPQSDDITMLAVRWKSP